MEGLLRPFQDKPMLILGNHCPRQVRCEAAYAVHREQREDEKESPRHIPDSCLASAAAQRRKSRHPESKITASEELTPREWRKRPFFTYTHASMKYQSSAVWKGGLKEGSGTMSTASGALVDKPYSFRTRFEGEPGTNPEELIGAAHAGCFSMALSNILGQAGFTPEKIETTATVTLEQKDGSFAVTSSHLDVRVSVPGASAEAFQQAAAKAKAGCPISKLLNANITMDAQLV
jgi:osmotically inducible protein OsmC